MTTDRNSEERAERSEERAERSKERADRREEAADRRDQRDSAAATRHQELRDEIEHTQEMVTDGAGDVLFSVQGLQDKFFEHLIFATNAIEDATKALEDEKKTRKIQIISLGVAVSLGLLLGILVLLNTASIQNQQKRSDQVACLAINEGRETIYDVLAGIFETSDARTDEEEQIILQELLEGDLLPLDCDNGISFSEEFTP